jgi:PAS domain S-box-containing protein
MTEDLYHRLFDNILDIVFHFDLTPSPHLAFVNPAVETITGYRPEDCYRDPHVLFNLIFPGGTNQLAGMAQEHTEAFNTHIINRWVGLDSSVRWIESRITPLVSPAGTLTAIEGISRDITRRKQLEDCLYREEQLLRLFIDHTPAAIAMLDNQMRYLAYSKRFLQDYNLQNQDITGRSHYEIFPEISNRWREIHRRCLAGAIESCEEDPFPRLDGTLDWVKWEIRPWHETDGTVGGILLLSEVITARKVMQNNLHDSLAEKEILLREVHHRVKNNLAAILGLLDLERMNIDDPAARAPLLELSHRIQSMSAVHEQLYRSANVARIDFQNYLLSFTSHLSTAFQGSCGSAGAVIRIDAEGVELDLDTAIPCGLIVNELVTNALKYAFPKTDQRNGKPRMIVVSMADVDGQWQLSVRDNGVGLPADLDWRSAKTIGLQLVHMLGEHQLHGRLQLDQSFGTQFTLCFGSNVKG